MMDIKDKKEKVHADNILHFELTNEDILMLQVIAMIYPNFNFLYPYYFDTMDSLKAALFFYLKELKQTLIQCKRTNLKAKRVPESFIKDYILIIKMLLNSQNWMNRWQKRKEKLWKAKFLILMVLLPWLVKILIFVFNFISKK